MLNLNLVSTRVNLKHVLAARSFCEVLFSVIKGLRMIFCSSFMIERPWIFWTTGLSKMRYS